MEKDLINIGELSNQLNISVRTIRYYEQVGVINLVPRDDNNNRLFDDYTFHWLKFVTYLRKTGMSIKSIVHYKELIEQGPSTIPERITILKNQKSQVLVNIEDERKQIAEIDHKLNNYQNEQDKYL